MTVAAVIVPAGVEEALADASGRTAVRRIVDAAWAGGAIPIIVVADDPDGRITAALQGSPASVVERFTASELQSYRAGTAAAGETVRETSAVLLWPGRMAWTDPETVTSLIEAHGRDPRSLSRPRRAGAFGWPVLLPIEHAADVLAGDGTVEEVLATNRIEALELGDPGSVSGLEVALDQLPDYAGPTEPVGGPPPEWGAAAADQPERGLTEERAGS